MASLTERQVQFEERPRDFCVVILAFSVISASWSERSAQESMQDSSTNSDPADCWEELGARKEVKFLPVLV